MNQRTAAAGSRRKAWTLLMAVAAVPLVASFAAPAYAQFPTGNDGRARDANNRVGSNGYNDAGPGAAGTGRPTANQVAEGNVTRGQSFRGGIVGRDPRAFRGVTAGRLSDLFIRDSSGVADLSASPGGVYSPTTFYGRSRAVPPPPGSIAQGATGGFLGGLPSDVYDNSRPFYSYRSTDRIYERENPFSRLQQDRQLQLTTGDRPGEGANEGAAGTNGPAGPMTLSASPLYGVRAFGPNDRTSAQDFFNARAGRNGAAAGERRDAFGIAIDPSTIQQMQRELNDTDLATGRLNRPNQQQDESNNLQGQGGANALPPGAVPSLSAQPIGTPQGRAGATGASGAFNAGNATPSVGTGTDQPQTAGGPAQPIQNDLQNSGGGGVTFRTVVPTAQQTPAYRNLMNRYQRANRQRDLTPEEQARWYNQLRKAQQQEGQAAQVPGNAAAQPGQLGQQPGTAAQRPGGATAPGGTIAPPPPLPLPPGPDARQPGTRNEPLRPAPVPRGSAEANHGANAPGAPATRPAAETPAGPQAPASEKPEKPVEIHSLAEGVKAPGLRDLLQTAEADLKAGRYDSSIEKYEQAERVAVDNPLILLGQAHAELAATYYRRAEATLRRAVAADPALLYGRYVLRDFIGQERLQYIANDLKDLAANNPRDVRPALLLAYLAYNTGLDQQAAAFLDDAAKRAGGKDETVDLLRRHWSLSSGGATNPSSPAPDLNK